VRFRPFHLAILVLLLCGANFAWAQLLPFGDDKLPTVSFSENYTDTLVPGPFGYDQIPDTSLSFTLTTSMKGVVVTDMLPADGTGTLALSAGNLALSLAVGDAVQTQSAGNTILTWTWTEPDPDTGEPVTFGTVSLQYNTKDLKLTVNFADHPSEFSIYAAEEAYSDEELDNISSKNLTFSVGPYGMENITLYISGTASTFDQTVSPGTDDEQTFTGLAKVRLTGVIDKDFPAIRTNTPVARSTVTELPATASGSWTDAHGIFQIEVQVNDDPYLPATLDGANWTASLPTLKVGANTINVRATDIDGHVTTTPNRSFNYSLMSNLTVTADGNAPGKVSSSFFNPLTFDPTKAAPKSVTKQKEGSSLVVTATPAATAVFDGWTSNKTLTAAQMASPRLSFTHEPNLGLTAHFLINPFIPVKGRYTGLGLAPSVAGTALFSATLNSNGTFTGSLKVGVVNLLLKGKFSNTGHYTASISSGKITYAIDLALNVSGTGDQKITGTIVGGAVNVNIDSDLSPFNAKTAPATQVGTYNAILPPADNQAAPYPVGVGFGRVTVAASGTVKFVGRLGSGTAITASARLSSKGKWAFFASLYAKQGVIAGLAAFDLTATDSDVTGAFNWFKPADAKPGKLFPESFSGQSNLTGAKFAKPAAGQRLMLDPDGLGQLKLDAPATTTPVALPALQVTLDASLGINHKLTATAASGAAVTTAQATFNAGTGVFSGNFMEGTVKRTFQGIVVPGPKVNHAAGYFLRAPRSGAVNLLPPPTPPSGS